MPKVNVYNINGEVVEEMELSDDIFGIEINEHAVYEVVKNQLANKRQGTQSAKNKSRSKRRWKKTLETKRDR
jgi:LSU ribosomal protein L4P